MTTPEPDRRCRTCRHWGKDKICNILDEKVKVIVGYEGYDWIETPPDFGCVHWEAKEAT